MSLQFTNGISSSRIQRNTGVIATTSNFTYTFWAKRTGTWAPIAIINNTAPSPENSGHAICVNDQYEDPYEVTVQLNWASTQIKAQYVLPLNEWVFFALIGSGTQMTLKYWDGSAYQSASNTQTAFTPASVRWGEAASGASNSFTGRLAHIREWNAALSDPELTAERTSTSAVRSANLVAAHALDGGSVAAAVVGTGGDYSASANVTYSADMPTITAAASTTGALASTLATVGLLATGTIGSAPVNFALIQLGSLLLNATASSGVAPTGNVVLYLSGGGTNTSQSASLGGAMSATLAPNRPFGVVPEDFFTQGRTIYRCFYARADGAAGSLRVWFQAETPSASTTVAVGWGAQRNETEISVADQFTAPPHVVFNAPGHSYPEGISGGLFDQGDWRAFWIRYTITATVPIASEKFSLIFGPS